MAFTSWASEHRVSHLAELGSRILDETLIARARLKI